ncbi:hypothetical protein EV401DRAFT_2067493 [Pisolithus croceorrhizus]|nr:hypothetical protein EV401DRAFT_2067493 [Pisolithus croceorrhizus]
MVSTHKSSSDDTEPAANVGSMPIMQQSHTMHYDCAPPPLQGQMKTMLIDETQNRYVGPVEPFMTTAGRFCDYLPKEFMLMEPSPILELIWTLTSPFQVCYSEPPSEKDKKAFESLNALVLRGQLDKEVLHT